MIYEACDLGKYTVDFCFFSFDCFSGVYLFIFYFV